MMIETEVKHVLAMSHECAGCLARTTIVLCLPACLLARQSSYLPLSITVTAHVERKLKINLGNSLG